MKAYFDLLDAIDEDYSSYDEEDEGFIRSGEIELNREDFVDIYGEGAGWNEFMGDTLVVGWYVDYPRSDDPSYCIDGIWSDLMDCSITNPAPKLEEYIVECIKTEFELLNRI